MDEINGISCEYIRENWLKYKNEMYNTPNYELLWTSLENKLKIDKNDIYLQILKQFLDDNVVFNYKKPQKYFTMMVEKIDHRTLVFKGINGEERKDVHALCDKIGLHHKSKPNPKRQSRKFLYIYKPKKWLWEYTEKNPYSESKEYYAQREIEKQIRLEKIKEKLSNKYCGICRKNGLETELFNSVYMSGLYCNDCIENSDDDLNGHKFEPISTNYNYYNY